MSDQAHKRIQVWAAWQVVALSLFVLAQQATSEGTEAAKLEASFTFWAHGTTVVLIDTSIGPVATRQWKFGDGVASVTEDRTVPHTFAKSGAYDVELTVKDAAGQQATTKARLNLTAAAATLTTGGRETSGGAPKLEARFDLATNGLTVIVKDASTGPVTSRTWSFDDGTPGVSEAREVAHTFARPGSYDVELKIADEAGKKDRQTQRVTVGVEARFTLFVKGLQGIFKNQSTGNPQTFEWRFGEGGAPSYEREPRYRYSKPGTYAVTLIVTGDDAVGDHDMVSEFVAVGQTPGPQADFSYRVAGRTILLHDCSTGGLGRPSWRFGDGNTSSLKHPRHEFNQDGTYAVTLTLSSPGGRDSVSRFVTVPRPAALTADFCYQTRSGNAASGFPVAFQDQSTAPPSAPDARSWDFGDESPPSKETSPIHRYRKAGRYQVTLTVTRKAGERDQQRRWVVIP